jgi:hypothetical protein
LRIWIYRFRMREEEEKRFVHQKVYKEFQRV